MSQPAVSVIVPARNAAATVGRALAALAAQDLEDPYEVVVVDNGSDDGTGEIAAAADGPVRVVRTEGLGPGGARNRGAREARAPMLAFTDSDCFPTTGWLRHGLAALERADLVQGAVRAEPERPPGPFDRTLWVLAENGLYETANLFVRRELFERLGGFEDWLPTRGRPWGEDVWFGWRARRGGATTAFAGEALVHHAVFSQSVRDYVWERHRLVNFPAMASRMPELRRSYCYRWLFLSNRSAAFDLALAAAVASGVALTPLPLIAAVPYLWVSGRRARRWRAYAPVVMAVDAITDVVAFGALAWGSVRWREPVL